MSKIKEAGGLEWMKATLLSLDATEKTPFEDGMMAALEMAITECYGLRFSVVPSFIPV